LAGIAMMTLARRERVSSAHATARTLEERSDMRMAPATKQWTLEELHRLPDDGNKYELVRGELFVTPPPAEEHETILARLSRILEPYIASHRLGFLYAPRSVVRFEGSEVEPDRMVRRRSPAGGRDWDDAPMPILVVEVLSGSTRRRDNIQKREFYLDAGVAEYWIVDPERETVRVVRRGRTDEITSRELTWAPAEADEPLRFDVRRLFSDSIE
jgi:Uma2 family endonuclease